MGQTVRPILGKWDQTSNITFVKWKLSYWHKQQDNPKYVSVECYFISITSVKGTLKITVHISVGKHLVRQVEQILHAIPSTLTESSLSAFVALRRCGIVVRAEVDAQLERLHFTDTLWTNVCHTSSQKCYAFLNPSPLSSNTCAALS